jgi:hypothetical protein
MIARRHQISLVYAVVALAAVLIALSVWQTVRLAERNYTLREAVAAARAGVVPSSFKTAAAAKSVDGEAAAELSRERELLRTAEAKAQELAAALQIAPAEELKSLGRIEELAKEGVQFLGALRDPKALQKAQMEGRPQLANVVVDDLIGYTLKLEAIGRLEAEPAEVAEVHAGALKEMLGLDQATHDRVRQMIAAEFATLREQGLIRSHRPIDGSEDWYARRDQAILNAAGRIEAVIPPDLRKPHAVAQVLSLGSGIRTRVVDQPSAREQGIEMFYEMPGLPRLRL